MPELHTLGGYALLPLSISMREVRDSKEQSRVHNFQEYATPAVPAEFQVDTTHIPTPANEDMNHSYYICTAASQPLDD